MSHRGSQLFDHRATAPSVLPMSPASPHPDTMSSLDRHSLEALNVSLSKVHKHVAILRQIRNSFVSPLCRMPYEIIVKIISFVPDPNEEDEHVSLLLAKTGPICHHIWSILKNSPKFWGHVDFTHRDSITFIYRCQGRPTRLWVRYGPSEGRNSRTTVVLQLWLAIATCSVESLEEFRFYGTQSDFDNFSWIFTNSLPRLHTLTVVSGRVQFSWAPEIIETWTISSNFLASLCSIQLKQVFIPWETCFTSHLVDLDLDYSQMTEEVSISMSSFVELLAVCNRLESLRLSCAGPDTQDEDLAHTPAANPVQLTNLRVFEICDDALNIAYIMNNLKFPDTTRIHAEPSIDWPEQLVHLALPRGTRISPDEGLIEWSPGQESTLSMGLTSFIYHADVDDEEFMGTFEFTFHCPFLEFVGFSTGDVTALELDFDLMFEPSQSVWSTVLVALPALQRLSCASGGIASLYFAPKFFAELGRGSNGNIQCPELKELDLSKFDLYDIVLMRDILLVLKERNKAKVSIQKLSLRNRSFEAFDFDLLRNFRLCVAEVELPKAVDEVVPRF